MAKIFGYYDSPVDVFPRTDLLHMEEAFNINFQSQTFIKNKLFGVGVGILNKYDCQPIVLKTKGVSLIFMGKIFNKKEKADSIFRAILRSVEADNVKLLTKLLRDINGIFLMVIHDFKDKKTHIVNDRYAMEPLYYYYDKDKLVFASEIKAIIADASIKRIIDWSFWNDFFQYGYAFGNKTPFENIYSLENGSVLTFQNGKISRLKYWDYHKIKIKRNLSTKSAINLGVKVLKSVFKRQGRNLKKFVVFLSGGFDSRCISCSLKRFTNVLFKNYSSNLHPSTGESDSVLSKKVSHILGVENIFISKPKNLYKKYFNNHFFIVDGLCTEHKWIPPLTESLYEELPNFDGIGGDVLLRGPFLTKDNVREYDSKKLTDFFTRQIVIKGRREQCALIYKYFSSPFADKLKPNNISMLKEFNSLGKIANKVTIFYLKNRTKNSITILARHLLGRKIYSYYPFFDNEFVEYALSIPPRMKLFGRLYFNILKKAFPDVMTIPTTNDIYLKNRVLDIDIKSTLKSKVTVDEDLQYLLNLMRTISTPHFINKDALQNQVKADIKKSVDPKKYLVSVLQFCIWYKEYHPNLS